MPVNNGDGKKEVRSVEEQPLDRGGHLSIKAVFVVNNFMYCAALITKIQAYLQDRKELHFWFPLQDLHIIRNFLSWKWTDSK